MVISLGTNFLDYSTKLTTILDNEVDVSHTLSHNGTFNPNGYKWLLAYDIEKDVMWRIEHHNMSALIEFKEVEAAWNFMEWLEEYDRNNSLYSD